MTLLFIAHDLSVVEHISDRIIVMYVGKIVEMTGTMELLKDPLHPYTEALVSSIPSDSDIKRGKKLREIPGIVPNNKREMDFCPFLERCPYARGKIRRKCKSACPELIEVSPGHYIRCYLFSS